MSGSGGSGSGPGPGFLKSLHEHKLKSFSIGTMGGSAASAKKKKELDRQQTEQAEVGQVYQEFVSAFQDDSSSRVSKTWIKAGTFDAGSRKEDDKGKGQIYKPAARIESSKPKPKEDAAGVSPMASKRPEKPGSKKKEKEKKKSNLELFKEELKAMQEERQERTKYKGHLRDGRSDGTMTAYRDMSGSSRDGSHDVGDPTTTNLYLGNLSPRLTEQGMLEMFGRYGPIASIKIMWPRTEDEKQRGKNCGFVAFMARSDGERALNSLSGRNVDGFEMKMGWGKPVPIPLQPIYIPPKLLKVTLPPAPSGLPFNTQPKNSRDIQRFGATGGGKAIVPSDPKEKRSYEKMVYHSTVRVVIPTDRTVLCLINRTVEFVVREGPMFEAMVMNKELNNPAFRFLFENQSPEHVYYRWRLFSILQGDNKDSWRPEPFKMFKGGSYWQPPVRNLFTQGMSDEYVEYSDEDEDDPRSASRRRRTERDRDASGRKGKKDAGLSDSQRDRFEDMLRNLYPDRNPIAEAMIWCLEHADAGEEIVDCISEALSIAETPMAKKVARLYLISDILHNCSVKGVHNVSYYRAGFQAKLPDIFKALHQYHEGIEARMRAEAFKQRVMACFRAWEDWALYPQDFLIKLQNIFLGLVPAGGDNGNNGESGPDLVTAVRNEVAAAEDEDDVDGKSMSEDDEDVDGIPLDGAALLKKAALKASSSAAGTPTSSGRPKSAVSQRSGRSDTDSQDGGCDSPELKVKKRASGFVPSKWEAVNPEEVQAQAVTTSKWEAFEGGDTGRRKKAITEPDEDEEEDVDGIPMDDDDRAAPAPVSTFDPNLSTASSDRRARLREIEIKVMQFQDEMEAGRIPSRAGWTISEQVEAFRKKLMKQSQTESSTSSTPTHRSSRRDRRNSNHDDDDTTEEADNDDDTPSRSRSSKKKKKKHRRSSSSRSRSRSRSRDRDREKKSRRRRRSSSSEDERERESSSSSRRKKSKRASRSRSRSPRKHKKKRH